MADPLPSLAGTAERWQRGDLAKKLMETVQSPLLSDLQAKTRLETTCRFIDALSAEALPANAATPVDLVARLRLPLLRLALLQPELMEAENSPAVELMNQIGRAEALAGKDPALCQTLEDFIQVLAEELLAGKCKQLYSRPIPNSMSYWLLSCKEGSAITSG